MSEIEIKKANVEENPDLHKVLELALEAGRILLRNGAEIFRVEETIDHICKRFDIEEVDSFVLSNGIFLTAHINGEESFAKVKHIPMAGIHLGIVTEVNALSREISAGMVGVDEAFERLKEIEKLPPKKSTYLVLAAGLGSGCFCYLLKANIWESLTAFVIGTLLYTFVIFAQKHSMSKIIINIVGGGFITVLALAATSMNLPFAVRLDKVIIGSILPLVPGVSFTNAIRDIADSDFISGTVRMIDALLVFVYIAIGVGFVLSAYNNILGGMAL